MIIEIIQHKCAHCGSEDIKKNGHNPNGKQQYKCKQCGRGGVVNPSVKYSEAFIEQVIAAYCERPSMRGIARIFKISRITLAKWLKKKAVNVLK